MRWDRTIRRSTLWVRALLVCGIAIFLVGCGGDDDVVQPTIPDISKALETHKALGEDAVQRYDQLLLTNDPADARSQLIAELDTTTGISDVGLGEDGTTIWWDVEGGFTHLFYTENSLTLGQSSQSASAESNRFDEISRTTPAGTPHTNKALALSLYNWQLVDQGLDDHIESICEGLGLYGYVCTYKAKETQADKTIVMDDFRKWNNYGVVAMSAHGGVSKNQVHFSTGVLVDDVSSQYNVDFIGGNLLPSNCLSTSTVVTAIAPGFFKKYYKNGLGNTLIYVAGCPLRNNTSFTDAIVGQGSAFFAWDNVTGPLQAENTGIDLFTQLLYEDRDCDEAYQQLVANGNAHSESPLADFGYDGDGELRLLAPWYVEATNPVHGETEVSPETIIAAAFSTDMDPSTINKNTFTLDPSVAGTVAYQEQTAGFFPSSNLAWGTTYTATITTGVKDLLGNSLQQNYSWSFTTADEPGQNCVDVVEGPWTFCLEDDFGGCILEFVDGDLTQTDCYVSYDDDGVFSGPLTGRYWSGENTVEQFEFYGDFMGTPPNSFNGMLMSTDGSGMYVYMTGHSGGSSQADGVAGVTRENKSTFRNLRRDLESHWDRLK